MNKPLKQHLIDPEICIRCHTCEATCPIEAITHNDDNVVVDFDKCNYCMDCIPVCPTGSIDEWRVVSTPYTLEAQFDFMELPEQEEFPASSPEQESSIEALDDEIAALLAQAHSGAGGKARAPATASKPAINLYNTARPAVATVQGNYRLTGGEQVDSDVRHIILDLGQLAFPVLEGQSVGVLPPGVDGNGKPYLPRLYSISSPRDGERANFNNLSLTVKREDKGVCSQYLCNLNKGDTVEITGPFGSTFLMPNDPSARLLMICTGTGAAPFRGFTMRYERSFGDSAQAMVPLTLVFGARTPEALPYFGPLNKVPDTLLNKQLVYSRIPGEEKRYVQDVLIDERSRISELLLDPNTCIYICGLRAMEAGVEAAFTDIAGAMGYSWSTLRDEMREQGRYHVETY
ncbi:benzoyl-CoA oxygenase/reductase, BoxA protein [Chromatiales bacterium (ex Bugula neritina AB1)]|nr:benzoyl-CoA oxygenase/reductase, BoxA protein [Chromatiales bacterium (ex Bugula neritina AB1)]